MVETVIIDCDPGIDDAMALVFALGADKLNLVKIHSITIVHGNSGSVELLGENACRILELVNRTDIHVYLGASHPMSCEYHGHSGIRFHHENGIGGVDIPIKVHKPNNSINAAVHIAQVARQNPEEITLITLGPLTNAALALRLEPNLPKLLKRWILMGGAVNARGNKSICAEANIHNDPEAASILFSAPWANPITMMPLDITHQILVGPEFFVALKELNNVTGNFIHDIGQHYLKVHLDLGLNEVPVHDSSAIYALLKPEWFRFEDLRIEIELKGEFTRGMTIADWRDHLGKEKQTKVALSTSHLNELKSFYIQCISALP